MDDYLPDDPVVDINAVIYQYTTVKETEDSMLVHVQNKDTQGSGYVFRETDDWSGLPSGTINKFVPVPNIDSSRFGEGSIEVEGKGIVTDQVVQYNYRIDMAEVNPGLPVELPEIPTIELYNALEDDSVSSQEVGTDEIYSDEGEGQGSEEVAEKASEEALALSSEFTQLAMFQAMANVTFSQAYNVQLDGGVYQETVDLRDTKLPENKRGLRNNLAQQVLHTKMVDLQYKER